jgi:hypothetical protein
MEKNVNILLFLAALFPACFGQELGTLLALALAVFAWTFKKNLGSFELAFLKKILFPVDLALFKKIGFPGPELLFKKA